MEENLYQCAKQYIETIEKIEATSDPQKLEKLEEFRAEYHWRFLEKLKKEGIEYKDRDHATKIAYKIIRKEL